MKQDDVPATSGRSITELGPELWRELHTTVTLETLHQWEAKLAAIGCECNSYYLAFKERNPPTAERFFEWSVDLHNAVNVKLGRRVFKPMVES